MRAAVAMRNAVRGPAAAWGRRGFNLGFGLGLAYGEATVGPIGFEGRQDYAAIGGVANLAARLCAEARDGQILVSRPVAEAVAGIAALAPLRPLAIKGFAAPVAVSAVVELRP